MTTLFYRRISLLCLLFTDPIVSFLSRRIVQKYPIRQFVNTPSLSDVFTRNKGTLVDEADYVVIGSGIGGLSCAAMLAYYGHSVVVLESHYLPGGCAHTFEVDGFAFDAGRLIIQVNNATAV